jgi:hypothetical protein
MSKSIQAIKALYNHRIKELESLENAVLASMAPEAKKAL